MYVEPVIWSILVRRQGFLTFDWEYPDSRAVPPCRI